ncbi:MAG: hypothetical protein K6A23_07765 [Butyrivibrio sp.]|nr:hypothetical protein [Butyrivibrio sp.]
MKSRFLIMIIVIASIVLVVGGVFVSNNSTTSAEDVRDSEMAGYTRITSVPGVSFYINSQFVDRATAVTQISDNVSFQKNQYYSYKNGTDQYILFNMEELVVAVQKGTDFWIAEAEDKEYSLLNTSLMNMWFTQGSKKFSCESENGMTVTLACAGVSLNTTTYGDFTGKLANINKDGEEWSIFVGVPGERYDKLSEASKDGISSIINTFAFSDNSELADQDIYAVSLSGEGEKEVVDTKEDIFEYDDGSLNLSNQSSIVDKDEEKAYTSTPYNMLSVGDNGLLSAFNDFKISYEEPIICPTNIYRGEEAENIIKDYCMQTGDYAYFDAPDGQSWEVLEYDLNYKNCENEDYVNIKLKGVDGEYLKYRGIKYVSRTYDMFHKASEDGNWIRHLYCYYPVPNGCYEYCIECGERESVTDEEVSAAYYHIVNEDAVHSEQDVTIAEENQTKEGDESVADSSEGSSSDEEEISEETDDAKEESSSEEVSDGYSANEVSLEEIQSEDTENQAGEASSKS